MNGVGNYAGWRWIFIIIGLVTTLAGIASIWLVQNFPDKAGCKFSSIRIKLEVLTGF